MVTIKDFASNSVMGVVRKVVNYLCDTLTPKVDGAIDHLPARFNGSFDNSSRNLTMTIESQGTSTENLTAVVNIPGGGSTGPTYSAGNGINITPQNAIEIDQNITATKASVDALQNSVGDCFNEVTYDSTTNKLTFTALDGQSNDLTLKGQEDPTDLRMISDVIAVAPATITQGNAVYYNTTLNEIFAPFENTRAVPTTYFKIFNTSKTENNPYYATIEITDEISTKIKAFFNQIKTKIEAIYPTATFSIIVYPYSFAQNAIPIYVATAISYYKEYAAGQYSERYQIPTEIKIPTNYKLERDVRLIVNNVYIRLL